jgi:RNA polymerase sigma-70 factor, ECF subfamily
MPELVCWAQETRADPGQPVGGAGMKAEELQALEQKIGGQLAAGDLPGAAEIALRGYGPEILGYLVRVTDSAEDASEIFAELCEDLWRGLAGFEGRCRFRTWMYYLATNARNRYWRDPYRRRGMPLGSEQMSRLVQEVRSSTLDFLRTEVKDRFREIQRQLEPEERELLILRVDRGMSWEQIVTVLGPETERPLDPDEARARAARLRQRYSRLLKKLRRLCEADGLLDGGSGKSSSR